MKVNILVALSIAISVLSTFVKADPKSEVPKEVRALEGTYIGSWTIFGIDDKGAVVKRMSWTDTMKADRAELKGDRAVVVTTDEMSFEGGNIPARKAEGKEGYFLDKDGGLGDYFIETFNQVHRMARLGDRVWSYAMPAVEQELIQLGFPKGASGQHVIVKVVANEQGVETHRVSRLTTVTWKDKEGNQQALQFVSLQGHHKRQ
jgi:hypothetical protein